MLMHICVSVFPYFGDGAVICVGRVRLRLIDFSIAVGLETNPALQPGENSPQFQFLCALAITFKCLKHNSSCQNLCCLPRKCS